MSGDDRMSAAEYRRRLAAGTIGEPEPEVATITRRYPEFELQKATAEFFAYALHPDAVALHIPNERANRLERMMLAAAGVLPGAPDWLILHRGRAYAIELKAGRNQQTPAQRDFERRSLQAGVPYVVARSVDEVEQVVKEWGVGR